MARLIKAESPRLAPLRDKLTEMPHLMDRLDEMIMERWAPLWSALRSPEEMAARLPPMDVFEEGNEVVAKCEVPGLKKEDLTVEVGPETITISGRKAKEEKVERRSYYRFERASGMFTRTVRLPCEVELEKAHSTYRDGVLEVRVPKAAGVKPTSKKVEIG
ncbi:MAG TPA: Hsp20/alpha crystallin family protein [Anaeromyxobacteraceae bacterium]|nr:Hsp20/alpha crystallin family protein [Anaeromyxobacteraceae bacterium]